MLFPKKTLNNYRSLVNIIIIYIEKKRQNLRMGHYMIWAIKKLKSYVNIFLKILRKDLLE